MALGEVEGKGAESCLDRAAEPQGGEISSRQRVLPTKAPSRLISPVWESQQLSGM